MGVLTAGNVLVTITALEATACVLIYMRVAWWRSAMGQHVFWFMVSCAAVLDVAALRVFFADYPWYVWLRIAVFSTLPVVWGWRLILLIHEQYDPEDNAPDTQEEELWPDTEKR